MNKIIVATFFILLLLSCHSTLCNEDLKDVRLSKYFELNVHQTVYEGKPTLGVSPAITMVENDKVSNFISKHERRFEYLLYKQLKLPVEQEISKDSLRFTNWFDSIVNSRNFYLQFRLLSGAIAADSLLSERTFSNDEMMLVASRFFMCDQVNEKDTSVGSHICVGINGQQDLKSTRDYTTLEAFCYEAIFNRKDKDDAFVEKFNGYISDEVGRQKESFTDFKIFLEKVRDACYARMQQDADLRKALLKYYDDNKNNLGIIINL